jgi:hypothetical protein
VFLSISTPSLSHEAAAPSSSSSGGLPELTLQETRKTYGRFAEIVEPPREGYVLTLKLNFSGLTRPKGTFEELINASSLRFASTSWLVAATHLILITMTTDGSRSEYMYVNRSREGH